MCGSRRCAKHLRKLRESRRSRHQALVRDCRSQGYQPCRQITSGAILHQVATEKTLRRPDGRYLFERSAHGDPVPGQCWAANADRQQPAPRCWHRCSLRHAPQFNAQGVCSRHRLRNVAPRPLQRRVSFPPRVASPANQACNPWLADGGDHLTVAMG